MIRHLSWLTITILMLALLGPLPARAQAMPEPGLYQPTDKSLTLSLARQDDGSWELVLWQGGELSGPGAGFAYAGRLVAEPGRGRLAGTWQALPGSCCPGRGRGELAVLSPTSLRFTSFAPSLDRPPWPVQADLVLNKVAEVPARDPMASLAGPWRLGLWYTDLLPDSQPADAVSGQLDITRGEGGVSAAWQGRPGQTSLTPQGGGLELSYQDPAAGYELIAYLRPQAGGLMLEGPFNSTLGRGQMRLVRSGLPAAPATPAAAGGQGELSGLWVDPRTGNDFYQIRGSAQGFDFTAYGGSLDSPRYLSKGRATPDGPGRFTAKAQDVAGQCCGNQGRLIFRLLPDGGMEVSSFWWPQGRPDPGNPAGEPYVIKRAAQQAEPQAAASRASRWPFTQASRPGLLPREAGAVRARFIWRPGEQPRAATIFSQGGYLRDMDLLVDQKGRLAARIFAGGAMVEPVAAEPLSPGEPHDAYLVYQAGDAARLYLDGQQVAEAPLPSPWAGSGSPYLVGASRWPGRAFSGDIEHVDLFAHAVDPAQPGPPDLTITPPPPPIEPTVEAQAQAGPARVRELVRMWQPGRLVHGYAVGPVEEQAMAGRGYLRQGPIAGLYSASPPEGGIGLWGFVHRGRGVMVLIPAQKSPPAPAGSDAAGLMGYALAKAGEGTVPLMELRGELPEPLRGGTAADVLYTTRPDTVKAAQAAGYGPPKVVAYVRPSQEPPFTPPVLYTWQGLWRGEGWGRFVASRKGDVLTMFWYYADLDGPHYLGRYHIAPDGRSADGMAVGRPGPRATYYRQHLELHLDSSDGPRMSITAWRLAAPLDDGRLVSFKNPKPMHTELHKQAQQPRPAEAQALAQALGGPAGDPAEAYKAALGKARAAGRLLER